MFDVKKAGRLLRKSWDDPSDLARELYDIVVAGGDRVIDNPVEMVAVSGATALLLTRVAKAAGVPASTTQARTKATPGGPARLASNRRPPTPSPPGLPSRAEAPSEFSRQIKAAATIGSPKGPLKAAALEIGEAKRGEKGKDGEGATGIKSTQSGEIQPNPPLRPRTAPDAAFARPYVAPLFSVPGAIKIEENAPVQFDRPPLVFNPITSDY